LGDGEAPTTAEVPECRHLCVDLVADPRQHLEAHLRQLRLLGQEGVIPDLKFGIEWNGHGEHGLPRVKVHARTLAAPFPSRQPISITSPSR
jgi:hypothetical protein